MIAAFRGGDNGLGWPRATDVRTTALRVAWLLAALAALLACSAKPPALPRVGPDDVILAFGDSLTFGTGAQPAESYPAALGQLIGREVVGAGVPGETTTQAMQRLPQVLDRYRPRLVLLCLGGNDLLRKVEPQVIEANLRALMRTMRDRGVASPIHPNAAGYRRMAEAVAKLLREAGAI